MAFVVKSYYYDGIKGAIADKGSEAVNALYDITMSDDGYNSSAEAKLREYTENFADKELMEMMVISKNGNVLFNTTGFEPDPNQAMPDFDQALLSSDNKAFWTGELNSGERVTAYTLIMRNEKGECVAGIRFVVSLVQADTRIMIAIIIIVFAFVGIMAMFIIPGLSFLNTTIVKPVRELSATAKRIAQGDYETKVTKRFDDEVG
ncbi:MAG: HAMP domain-containing protein, partial [Clostridia bacterium]|nr:HAMP domain-containing protein [Clostridia bacterium]